jgi:hypothetical protein
LIRARIGVIIYASKKHSILWWIVKRNLILEAHMKKTIYCKTVSKGVQAFYVEFGANTYFLFNQKYYVGVRDFFVRGQDINKLALASKHYNSAVRRTAKKLSSYLQYIEKEYGIVIFDKKDKLKSKTYKKHKTKPVSVINLINEYYYGEVC